ncbi:MAG TPA: cytochrome c peroxidase [Polyangiaceae bacterium]|nr:cytochrome c peroxidase [Polyangiaceae bacterium]
MAVALPVACGAPDGAAKHGASDAGATASDAGGAAPWPVQEFPAVPAPIDNPTTDEKIALGRMLFYDPVASVDRQLACGTCHSEFWGMADALPVSVGNGGGLVAGPGRQGPRTTRRNAPTLWNAAFRSHLFWDGRGASLEDQVHFPFDAPEELSRPLADVVAEIRAIPAYASAFASAFPGAGDPVTEANFTRAVAAFERTMISRRGLYDAWVEGDTGAMSDSMLRGMRLFAEEGCPDCHRPPLFSSDRFEDRHVPPVPGVDDAGRFEVTGDPADRNRFAVPTLRNLPDSGPYFHSGAVETLGEAVRHEVAESAVAAGARSLDDDEVSDLTVFLQKALFDTTNSPSRPHEVPSGLPLPIDGPGVRH